MDISLDELAIKIPIRPTRSWTLNNRDWEEYKVEGRLDGTVVGYIKITRGLNVCGRYNDRFFLDMSFWTPVPKPYVSYQHTEEDFRGNGICGKLIMTANEFYRKKLGTTIYSDTSFVFSFKEQSKQVWRKLQAQRLAAFEPYVTETGESLDRWHCR